MTWRDTLHDLAPTVFGAVIAIGFIVVFTLCAIAVGRSMTRIEHVEPTPNYAITPRCNAIEVVQRLDTVIYEVVRFRGERCKLTLPEDAIR